MTAVIQNKMVNGSNKTFVQVTKFSANQVENKIVLHGGKRKKVCYGFQKRCPQDIARSDIQCQF